MQDAFLDEIIEKNPFDRVKKPSHRKKKIYPFTLQEVKLLIDQSEGWLRNFLVIAFFTGMRTGEMLALRWENIDLDRNLIYVRKSMRKGKLADCKTDNSLRDIDILPVVKNALLDQYTLTGSQQTVFVNQYGNPYTRSDKIASSK